MEVETLKTKKQDLERNLKTSEEQIRQLRTSLKIGENVRNTMEKTIKDRTSKLEHVNDENHKLQLSVKNAGNENRKLTRSVKNAEDENRKLQHSVKNAEDENRKLTRSVKEAQDKVKSSENDLQTATGKNWKYYTDFKNADNRAKQLDHALQNASDKVKELERSLQETNHNFTALKNSIHLQKDQNEISSLIQTNQQLNDDIKKIEHENVDLLLSLEKAQEILSSVSPYIVGGDKHHRTYLVPLEPQRNRTSITYKDEYEKKALLVERFQRLNDALVESNILDKAIYDTFIGTFQKAITVLCEPKMPIKQRNSTLYRTYVKKDFIPTSEISKLKDLTIQSFSCFKSTVSATKPVHLVR
jgi:chromosome segregation ATPase